MQRWPAQPVNESTTPRTVTVGIGVGHHDEVVLGPAQAQRALARAAARRVDRSRDRGRADEADRGDAG